MTREEAVRILYSLLEHPLHTERYIIRKTSEEDINDLHGILGSEEVMSIVGTRAFTSAEIIRHLDYINENITKAYKLGLVVEEKMSNKVVATVGLKLKNIEKDIIEFEYLVNPSYWNRGLMTEVIHGIIRFITSIDYPFFIEANCRVSNIGSEKVMIKNNMTYIYSDYYDEIEYRRFRYDRKKV